MWVSLHAGTAELVSCILLIWTCFTCYTGLVGSFSLSASPAAGRRFIEITVVSFASGGESGRLFSVPESKNIYILCRQLGNQPETLFYFHNMGARQKSRRLTSDEVF